MKNILVRLGFVTSVLFSGVSAADEMLEAAQDLCEWVKTCSMAQVHQGDLTPEIRQMLEPMMASVCITMQARFPEIPKSHAAYQPALACMKSMTKLSCDAMQGMDDTPTPECKEYEKLSEQYSPGK